MLRILRVLQSQCEEINLFLQNRTLKPNLYILTYILFLSKTFGQALDRLVNVS